MLKIEKRHKKTNYYVEAGIDFTHCEKGYCTSCSRKQQKKCENKENKHIEKSIKEGK